MEMLQYGCCDFIHLFLFSWLGKEIQMGITNLKIISKKAEGNKHNL